MTAGVTVAVPVTWAVGGREDAVLVRGPRWKPRGERLRHLDLPKVWDAYVAIAGYQGDHWTHYDSGYTPDADLTPEQIRWRVAAGIWRVVLLLRECLLSDAMDLGRVR